MDRRDENKQIAKGCSVNADFTEPLREVPRQSLHMVLAVGIGAKECTAILYRWVTKTQATEGENLDVVRCSPTTNSCDLVATHGSSTREFSPRPFAPRQ
jgi:hypothetical protein